MSVGLRAPDVRSVDLVENLNRGRSPAAGCLYLRRGLCPPVSRTQVAALARSCVVFATVLSRSGGRAGAGERGSRDANTLRV